MVKYLGFFSKLLFLYYLCLTNRMLFFFSLCLFFFFLVSFMYVNVPFVVFLYPQFNLVICTTTAAHEPNTVVQSGRATNIYCAFIYPSISIYYMYQSFYISYGFDLCITLRMCGFVSFILSLKNFDISQNKNKQLVHCSTHTHTLNILYKIVHDQHTKHNTHTEFWKAKLGKYMQCIFQSNTDI